MKLKIGYQELIARAMGEIETLTLEQAEQLLGDSNTVFVDIRDVRELEREDDSERISCPKRNVGVLG